MKGYKVFNSDWTCKGFQFKVGETYTHKGEIKHCQSGFHFCIKLVDCFNYYRFDPENKIAEVEAVDKWITDGDKTVCNKIKIIRELKWDECLELVNMGKGNTGKNNSGSYNPGYCNSGNYNSGDYNSGNLNSGNYNSGNYNSGDYNSGNLNSGNYNSGNYNSGDYNSGNLNSGNYNSGSYNSGDYNPGDYNSGDYNSGDYNSGDYNPGYCNSGNYNLGMFNSDEPCVRLFNKQTKYKYNDKIFNRVKEIIANNFYQNFVVWVSEDKMTEQEKKDYPSYKTTGGYLRTASYKDAWKLMWDNISKEDKKEFYKLPNFDWKIFTKITGIKKGVK
jgi:hypothetical protein